jgi:DNA-binding NtrC family response regulator
MTTGNVIEKIEMPTLSPVAEDRRALNPLANTLNDWLMEQEKQYLIQQLGSYQGKIALTAKNSGLGIRTLTRKMRMYGLEKKDFRPKTDDDAQPTNKGGSKNHTTRPRLPRPS